MRPTELSEKEITSDVIGAFFDVPLALERESVSSGSCVGDFGGIQDSGAVEEGRSES
jgi:hypothetical protein